MPLQESQVVDRVEFDVFTTPAPAFNSPAVTARSEPRYPASGDGGTPVVAWAGGGGGPSALLCVHGLDQSNPSYRLMILQLY